MLLQLAKPFAHHEHPREIVRQFTPNWFTVTMGTGVVALAINQFPVDLPVLHQAGAVLWLVNIGLFMFCAALYGGRWIFFTADAMPIWGHPVMPMFLGAIPMGLATIVNGFLVFGIPYIGALATGIAVVLWWIDAIMAVAIGLLARTLGPNAVQGPGLTFLLDNLQNFILLNCFLGMFNLLPLPPFDGSRMMLG